MARAKIIGSFAFPTRKQAEEKIRAILHGSEMHRPLTGDEHDLIAALIGCHPDATDKIGPGIRTIEVRRIEFGAPGFWITRIDGTSIDFSYRKALDGAHPSHRAQVTAALRRAVNDQINAFRDGYFTATPTPTCPLTGQHLRRREANVDHDDPTFTELADTFINVAGHGDPTNIPVQAAPNGIGDVLANPLHLTAWQQWHKDRARLRVIHRSANLARIRRDTGAAA